MNEFQQLLLPLTALAAAILISVFNKQFSLGLFGFTASFFIGPLLPNTSFQEVLALFPSALFLQLMGLFLFFALVEESGFINKLISKHFSRLSKRLYLLPLIVFLTAASLSASGVGNISTLALLAPLCLGLAEKSKMPLFSMTLLLVGGANAASLSPLTTAGILVHNSLHKMNLAPQLTAERVGLEVFLYVLFSVTIVTFLTFLISGGWAWTKEILRQPYKPIDIKSEIYIKSKDQELAQKHTKDQQALTYCIAATAALVALSIGLQLLPNLSEGSLKESAVIAKSIFSLPVLGWTMAFFATALKWTQSEKLLKSVSWDVLLLIVGMAFFVEVLAKAGFAQWVAALWVNSLPLSLVPSMLALSSGFLSTFSSSTGVVLPLFLPLIQELHSQFQGKIDLNAMLFPMILGSHLVDISPLSTLGAICIAAVKKPEFKTKLYQKLLLCGFTMIPIGAVIGFLSSFFL